MTRMVSWIMSRLRRDEEGQGTVEYVLVMLAVTAVAVVLISWAKSGSGKNALGDLFDSVIGWVTDAAKKFRL